MTNKRLIIAAFIGLMLAIIANGVLVFLVIEERSERGAERSTDLALSAYQNCEQNEAIKTQIRGTLEDSKKELEKGAFVQLKPDERQQQLYNLKKQLLRFGAINCAEQPSARLIKGLPKGGKHAGAVRKGSSHKQRDKAKLPNK